MNVRLEPTASAVSVAVHRVFRFKRQTNPCDPCCRSWMICLLMVLAGHDLQASYRRRLPTRLDKLQDQPVRVFDQDGTGVAKSIRTLQNADTLRSKVRQHRVQFWKGQPNVIDDLTVRA